MPALPGIFTGVVNIAVIDAGETRKINHEDGQEGPFCSLLSVLRFFVVDFPQEGGNEFNQSKSKIGGSKSRLEVSESFKPAAHRTDILARNDYLRARRSGGGCVCCVEGACKNNALISGGRPEDSFDLL